METLAIKSLSGGGGNGVKFVGNVQSGGAFPTKRLNGDALVPGDYVRPKGTFPFTISGVTFNSTRDKAVYSTSGWLIDAGVAQDTAETPVRDKASESLAGTSGTQAAINKENKAAINNKADAANVYTKSETDTLLNDKASKYHGHNTASKFDPGFMGSEDKKKLDGIEAEANKTIVDDALSSTSTNPVQNKVVKSALDEKSYVFVSDTGTATDEVNYITIDGVEKKIAGSGGSGVTKEYVDDGDTNTLQTSKKYADDLHTDVQTSITAINGKIDAAASITDQLIPESKIDRKIASGMSRILYKDASQSTFATHAELVGATKYYNAKGDVVEPNETDGAFVIADETHGDRKSRYTVQSTSPVVWAFVMEWNENTLTLNGEVKTGQDVDFYAAVDSGTAGQVLQSNGANAAPVWTDMEFSDTSRYYYQHNITAKDNDGLFLLFSFVNTKKDPYSTTRYGTSLAANKAIGKALYDAGFVDINRILSAAGIKNGVATYHSVYGDNTNSGFNYCREGYFVKGGWTYFYDNVVKVGGSIGYTGGTNIGITDENVINNLQHVKPYDSAIEAGNTEVAIAIDEGYVPLNVMCMDDSGNGIQLDQKLDPTTNVITLSIAQAVSYDIYVRVTALANADTTTLINSCPYIVSQVVEFASNVDPNEVWRGTSWTQLEDGCYTANTTDNSLVGTIQGEELPNIKGKLVDGLDGWYVAMAGVYVHDGALSASLNTSLGNKDRSEGASRQNRHRQIDFNAHDSNPIYKDGGKVRPKSLLVKKWVRNS